MSYYQDIYHSPEKLGVEHVGELDLREPDYSFDILLVSRDLETGKFYVNSDSGCSCPSPFEDFTDRLSLGRAHTAHEAVAAVKSIVDDYGSNEWDYKSKTPDPSELISKIMSY